MKHMHQHTQNETIDLRADTFDVLNYTINAEFLDYQNKKEILAVCILTVHSKLPANTLTLDLLGLPVFMVSVDDELVDFTYDNEKLKVIISDARTRKDTFKLAISYGGNPKRDPSWGGFYFTGEYAFNLGVGFESDPHNFGRVWFPCFDNFVDRSTYNMNITVDSGYSAYGNGLLDKVTNGVNKTQTYHWVMDEEIPTYLAAVAIADYEEINMEVAGIPVILTALAKDTSDLRTSFENLPICINQFIDKYGPHTFDRIGFNMVPFNSGAMEHATNIAYPLSTIKGGSKAAETLYAHELAHHWWGNTITCKTQEEMWLNEGWASYSEALFLEAVYGKGRYKTYVEQNHRDVLQFAHIRDGESLPVSGIGWENTYGNHVYNKGADMVHSLRGIMGDESFFEACKSFQNKFRLKSVTTEDMEIEFQKFTPYNLSSFFNLWVKKQGFAHFDKHWVIERDGVYSLSVKQTPRFNEEVYEFPLTITGFSNDMTRFDTTVVLNSALQTFEITPPNSIAYWCLDYDDKLSDASTTADFVITKKGGYVMEDDGLMTVTVDSVTTNDSLLLRVEHHWAPADASYGLPGGVEISTQRYWNVDGIWNDYSKLSSTLKYSAIKTTNPTYGYLDDQLIKITEDSLVLLFRPSGNAAWSLYSDYEVLTGSKFDKRGDITITNLKKGQYAVGMHDQGLASEVVYREKRDVFKVYPNPADDVIKIEFEEKHNCCLLEITNSFGQVVKTKKLRVNKEVYKVDVDDLVAGTYFVGVVTDNIAYDIVRFVVK